MSRFTKRGKGTIAEIQRFLREPTFLDGHRLALVAPAAAPSWRTCLAYCGKVISVQATGVDHKPTNELRARGELPYVCKGCRSECEGLEWLAQNDHLEFERTALAMVKVPKASAA